MSATDHCYQPADPPNPARCTMAAVEITSFGYLHGGPPPAHLVCDMRAHFRDPHVSSQLRYLTAQDARVREVVLGTAGVRQLIDAAASAVMAFRQGPAGGLVRVAFGCAGGRHRAATAALILANRLRHRGIAATVTHRDLRKPFVDR